jgi:hypothetical protein
MLKDLIKIATALDSIGLTKEADQIDYIIKKISTTVSYDEFDDIDMILRKMYLASLNNMPINFPKAIREDVAKGFTEKTVTKVGSLVRDHLILESENESVEDEIPSDLSEKDLYNAMINHARIFIEEYKVNLNDAATEIYNIALHFVGDIEKYVNAE